MILKIYGATKRRTRCSIYLYASTSGCECMYIQGGLSKIITFVGISKSQGPARMNFFAWGPWISSEARLLPNRKQYKNYLLNNFCTLKEREILYELKWVCDLINSLYKVLQNLHLPWYHMKVHAHVKQEFKNSAFLYRMIRNTFKPLWKCMGWCFSKD